MIPTRVRHVFTFNVDGLETDKDIADRYDSDQIESDNTSKVDKETSDRDNDESSDSVTDYQGSGTLDGDNDESSDGGRDYQESDTSSILHSTSPTPTPTGIVDEGNC